MYVSPNACMGFSLQVEFIFNHTYILFNYQKGIELQQASLSHISKHFNSYNSLLLACAIKHINFHIAIEYNNEATVAFIFQIPLMHYLACVTCMLNTQHTQYVLIQHPTLPYAAYISILAMYLLFYFTYIIIYCICDNALTTYICM